MKTIFIRRDTILKRIYNHYGGFVLGGVFGVVLAYMFVGTIDRGNKTDLDKEIKLAEQSSMKHCTRKQNSQVLKDVKSCTSLGNGDNHCWNLAIVKDCGDEK